jgi:hypothetical protein
MKLPALKEIVEERKGRAIESLSASFAENRLPLEEYERLAEYIHKIESERELLVVEKIVAEYGGDSGPGGSARAEGGPWAGDDEGHQPGAYARTKLTILSARSFAGPLEPGAQFVSILGSGTIRIRREDLRCRRTLVQVISLLGDSLILVEPGIRVISQAIPILGNATTDHRVGKAAEGSAPELVIGGAALLGNITVRPLKD